MSVLTALILEDVLLKILGELRGGGGWVRRPARLDERAYRNESATGGVTHSSTIRTDGARGGGGSMGGSHKRDNGEESGKGHSTRSVRVEGGTGEGEGSIVLRTLLQDPSHFIPAFPPTKKEKGDISPGSKFEYSSRGAHSVRGAWPPGQCNTTEAADRSRPLQVREHEYSTNISNRCAG
jgi:hypothetical protein